MDQGTHLIHVFDPEFNELDRIDMAAHDARVPHMIDFTSDRAYALVANPATGNAYISLGPLLHEGGLVVLDTETFRLVRVYSPVEVDANCGTLLSPTGEHVFANAGDAKRRSR